LETVHEDEDDKSSDSQSEITAVQTMFDYGMLASSVGRASSGSFSDPGDSYGGREYGKDDIHIS